LTTPVQSRPTHGRFNFRLGQAKVAVEFEAEDARIDLNMAPKQLLIGLFQELGAHRSDAENYGDRIIAWRTASPPGQNSEASISAGLRNRQRNAKLPHANELALVLDLPAGILERALSLVTVYSGRAQVNVLEAPPQVLAALPGMTGDRLDAVLAQRRASPDNRRDLLALLKGSEPYVTTEGSNALRVKVSIAFDNGRKANSEVVILIFDEGDEPFAVLSWRDDLDGLTAGDRQRGQLP
jgi:general secretion pathway protein K